MGDRAAARIAVIGGGAFVPALGEALAREARLPPVEVRLAARRRERLEVIAAHTARRVAAIRPDFEVTACGSIAEAVEGARAVVLLVRVGGHAARAHDEAFPWRYGLVGDEGLGVGGIANAWRTVPVLAEMARVVRAGAPGAVVVNLVAPLGVTTRVLLDEGLDAIGVCELPEVTLGRMAEAAGVRAGDIEFRYGGLNHLGWFWEARARGGGEGRDVIRAAIEAGTADEATVARFGGAPLHYYYDVFAPEAAARLGRRKEVGRAAWLSALSERLITRFGEAPGEAAPEIARRPTPWFERAAVPVVAARIAGVPYRGFVNVKNRGLWAALPAEVVIEAAATVDEEGVKAVPPGLVPSEVARFSAAVARAEEIVYQAARERSAGLVEEAIAALPMGVVREQVKGLAREACERVVEGGAG